MISQPASSPASRLQQSHAVACLSAMYRAQARQCQTRANQGLWFVQIAKLLIIPFVCLVERFWLGKTFSRSVIASVVTVVIGVAIV